MMASGHESAIRLKGRDCIGKEFENSSTESYSADAFKFWEKPVTHGANGSNIVEKIGSNGNLYRFEPAMETLGIAAIDERKRKII